MSLKISILKISFGSYTLVPTNSRYQLTKCDPLALHVWTMKRLERLKRAALHVQRAPQASYSPVAVMTFSRYSTVLRLA